MGLSIRTVGDGHSLRGARRLKARPPGVRAAVVVSLPLPAALAAWIAMLTGPQNSLVL